MKKLNFGWRMPSFPIDDSDTQTFILQIKRFLDEIEGTFNSAWISDHFVPWATFQSVETDTLEAWTTICYFSGIYEDLDFGNIVLCQSYRNPALLAKMAATLQSLTNGRLILGIGAGWKEDEYLAYGYDFPSAKTRIAQLEEAVQIIKALWSEDSVSFEGDFYKVKDAYCNPKPQPIPPIMIGGGGERFLLRVVARFAEWWNLANVTVDEYRRKIDVLKAHCEAVSRNPNEIKRTLGGHVAIAKDESEALKITKESPFLKDQNWDAHFIGTPERIRDKILEYADLGVEYFILRFLDFPRTDGIKLFMKEVIEKLN